MVKLILSIVVVLAIAAAAILIFAATKPDRIRIERKTLIHTSPDKVMALVANLHDWPAWAPQDREDRTMRRSFDGAPKGLGARSTWTSKGTAGAGRMEITGLTGRSVVVTVDFARPFRAHNVNTFDFATRGNETEVTWTMQGTNPYMAKVMSVFVDMDKMMGQHFENGLANLKAAAEK